MAMTARKSARLADPQSGPAATSRGNLPGHFHFSMAWVVCEPGRITALAVSQYINRVKDGVRDAEPSRDLAGREMEAAQAERLSDYLNRSGRKDAAAELGAHVLCTRGLKIGSSPELSRVLDAAERKKDRTYRCYGGRLPRAAVHLIASIRRGISDEQSGKMLVAFVTAVSDRLQIPIEGRVHKVGGVPDHIDVMLGTRVVENGRMGKKQRQLDAVSEKADGQGLAVGDRLIGPTVEWMRSEWAGLNLELSGDLSIDHRSYARREMAVRPVAYVSRADIEFERRRGTAAWRTRRANEIAAREVKTAPTSEGLEPDTDRHRMPVHVDSVASQDVPEHRHDNDVSNQDQADGLGSAQRATIIGAMKDRAIALIRNLGLLPGRRRAELVGEQHGFSGVDFGASIDELAQVFANPRGQSDRSAAPVLEPDPGMSEGGSPGSLLGAKDENAEKPMPEVPIGCAVAATLDLRRRRRLSTQRSVELADLVGIEPAALEVAIRRSGEQGPNPSPADPLASPPIRALQELWAEEDNRARRDRRARSAEQRRDTAEERGPAPPAPPATPDRVAPAPSAPSPSKPDGMVSEIDISQGQAGAAIEAFPTRSTQNRMRPAVPAPNRRQVSPVPNASDGAPAESDESSARRSPWLRDIEAEESLAMHRRVAQAFEAEYTAEIKRRNAIAEQDAARPSPAVAVRSRRDVYEAQPTRSVRPPDDMTVNNPAIRHKPVDDVSIDWSPETMATPNADQGGTPVETPMHDQSTSALNGRQQLAVIMAQRLNVLGKGSRTRVSRLAALAGMGTEALEGAAAIASEPAYDATLLLADEPALAAAWSAWMSEDRIIDQRASAARQPGFVGVGPPVASVCPVLAPGGAGTATALSGGLALPETPKPNGVAPSTLSARNGDDLPIDRTSEAGETDRPSAPGPATEGRSIDARWRLIAVDYCLWLRSRPDGLWVRDIAERLASAVGLGIAALEQAARRRCRDRYGQDSPRRTTSNQREELAVEVTKAAQAAGFNELLAIRQDVLTVIGRKRTAAESVAGRSGRGSNDGSGIE